MRRRAGCVDDGDSLGMVTARLENDVVYVFARAINGKVSSLEHGANCSLFAKGALSETQELKAAAISAVNFASSSACSCGDQQLKRSMYCCMAEMGSVER